LYLRGLLLRGGERMERIDGGREGRACESEA